MFATVLNVITFILSVETWTKIFTVSQRIRDLDANGELQVVRDAMTLGMDILFPPDPVEPPV